eukprot:6453549-Amphidinium_carterae.1
MSVKFLTGFAQFGRIFSTFYGISAFGKLPSCSIPVRGVANYNNFGPRFCKRKHGNKHLSDVTNMALLHFGRVVHSGYSLQSDTQ